ncbi:ABC transporter substrate-binding protein [Rathayibacter soli]|uniref:ABC transporter substrate-binding protein n=1 Tax=Rathayibacter soli TaxID=3144168 RepID=UPI0027E40172|nr:glycine betaine ABC transporter substrate-binding protein [Glaciibacter superstes]
MFAKRVFAGRRGLIAGGVLAVGALVLAGCSSGNPLSNTTTAASGSSASTTVTVGSAAFPENEIIAQIYAQALAANGVTVKTQLNIGQRAVYLAALKDGSIDLVPEYSGNLLQNYDPKSTAQSSEDVYAALNDALPKGFEVLKQSAAQDADSYNVTKEFSDKNNVKSLADLAGLNIPLTVAGNPELGQRPYGIPGLKSVYGVSATLLPISDSGGPNTVKALIDNQAQLADIFTTTPAIKANGFVTLADPQHMIVAQNVVPLINSKKATEKVTTVLNKISAALTTQDLIAMNTLSSGSAKESADAIAKQWLAQKNLFG